MTGSWCCTTCLWVCYPPPDHLSLHRRNVLSHPCWRRSHPETSDYAIYVVFRHISSPCLPFSLDIEDAPVPLHGGTSFYRHTQVSRQLCGQSQHLPIARAFSSVYGSWYLAVPVSSGRYPGCPSGSRQACAHAGRTSYPQNQSPASFPSFHKVGLFRYVRSSGQKYSSSAPRDGIICRFLIRFPSIRMLSTNGATVSLKAFPSFNR